MMQGILQLPTTHLLAAFASAEPAPGGGSASALAGALASALIQMVGRLSEGKKGYETIQAEVRAIQEQAEALMGHLQRAVSEDAEAFDAVMAAMGLPKESESQKFTRHEAIQTALKQATLTPLKVTESCLSAGRLGLSILAIGNKNASTDAGVAVLLALAGAEGALFNAAINLGSIKDTAWVELERQRSSAFFQEAERLRRDLWPTMGLRGVLLPQAGLLPVALERN
jgi:formiminotetrahydrofolate cyclodeaminase